MTRRLFGRSRGADPGAPTGAPSLPPGLNPDPRPITVTLFTADGVGEVQMLAGKGRFTELLNAPDPVRVRALPEAGEGAEPEWVDLDLEERDEMLAVAPPPQDTNPLLRLHRPAQAVNIRVGPYLFIGEAHVPAGSEAVGFLMRHRPHFIPLTRARIRQEAEADITVAVVIVNLWMADALTNASLAAPEHAEASEADEVPDAADAPPAPGPEEASLSEP